MHVPHLTQINLIFSILCSPVMYDSSRARENIVLSVIFCSLRTLIFRDAFCRWRSFIFGGALVLSVTNLYFRRMAPVNKKKLRVDWGSWALVNFENCFQVQERRQCLNSGDGLPNRHSETTAKLYSVKRITNVAATFLLRLQFRQRGLIFQAKPHDKKMSAIMKCFFLTHWCAQFTV